MVDLDGTVDEVKQQIRDAEDPDYSELLEEEKEGKDRKTIKEFLQKRIDGEDEDAVEEVEEIQEEMEDEQEEVEEELVEEIEEETSGGLLSGFTGPQLLAGGVMLGLVVGLIVGALTLPMNQQVSPEQAEMTVGELVTASGGNAEVTHTGMESGLHSLNVSQEVTQGNQTVTSTRVYYLTGDGKLLIPRTMRTAFGQQRSVVSSVEDIRQAIEERQERPPANETQPENTTQPSGNQTQ